MSQPATKPAAQGSLTRYPLPRLVFMIYRKRLTGYLSLKAAGEQVTLIYFRDGTPVMALLPRNAEHLGRILLETGVINQATFDESLQRLASTGMRQGEILLEMGAITEEQLSQGLKLQLRRKLIGLFALRDGEFEIYAVDHPYGRGEEAAQMRVHPRRIIYHGVRHCYDDARLAAEGGALAGRRVRLRPDAAKSLEKYGFEEDDLPVVRALGDRAFTAEELAAATGADETLVRMILFTLFVTEMLEAVEEGEEQAAPRAAAAAPAAARPVQAAAPAAPRPTGPPTPRPAPAAACPAPSSPAPPAAGATADPAAKAKLRQQIEAKAKGLETETLFQVLGLEQTAGKDQIREAYLELARTFHPDRLHGSGLDELRPVMDRVFSRISEAHATLMDDERRRTYVASLTNGGELNKGQKILEAELSFQKGTVLLRRRDFAGAITELKRAVTLNPDEGEHHAALAWATWHTASDKSAAAGEARRALAHALELAPRCKAAHFYRAEILMALGAEAEALAAYRRVLELDENHIDAQRAVRLLVGRLEKNAKKGGLFDRFRKK
jgi:tetratricopeptide (TPR) repeat protein